MRLLDFVWLIPALPLAAFLLGVVFTKQFSRRTVAFLATVPTGFSALLAALIAVGFIMHPPSNGHYTVSLWTWLRIGGFAPELFLYVDPLAIVMILVVCFVSFFINLYSTEFMSNDEGYGRFFSYMNLFIGSMLILLLAGDLLFLYLGWEAVGLCSYLLIGFWYREPENGRAAIKSFLVTRVGDTALAIGLFVLFLGFGSLSIPDLLAGAKGLPAGSDMAVVASTLILIGALGKSAQLPLQIWLPDAMAGPTPVSALIHAATMVTAGVYLIARTHPLFLAAPQVLWAVAAIGGLTVIVAGCSALAQRRIKRVLAYSTISQIGYMFLALGVGAWSAAIFHFMTHAFFKALLFLATGVVIQALKEEQDLFRMGGLRTRFPLVFWTFLIGGCSLASLPLVTAGFYSKELIISEAWLRGGVVFWLAGVAGAFLTALYTFRMVFLVFFGHRRAIGHKPAGLPIKIPLIVFAAGSVFTGFVQVPDFLEGSPFLDSFLSGTFPARSDHGYSMPLSMSAVVSMVSLLGIALAYLFFLTRPHWAIALLTPGPLRFVRRVWAAGWGFDWIYDRVLVAPFVSFSRINKSDVIDLPFRLLARANTFLSRTLTLSQSGKVRWYAMGVALGAVVITGMVIFL